MPDQRDESQRAAKGLSQRRLRLERTRAGYCGECGKYKRLAKISRCKRCKLEQLARQHLGIASRWRELADILLQQSHRCAYSGKHLTLGENASIEHVAPVSRNAHRKTDIRNLVWVDIDVNHMKYNMTIAEFLSACRGVLETFGYRVRR